MIKAVLQHPGGSVDLLEGEVIIGRGLGCPIRFNDHSVSRKHVKLIVTADSITVRDLGSRNGTKLNAAPLKSSTTLRDGDILQIGSVQLRLVVFATHQTFMDEAVTSPNAPMPDEVDPAQRLLSNADGGNVRDAGTSNDAAADEGAAETAEQHETLPLRSVGNQGSGNRIWDPGRDQPGTPKSPIALIRDSTELPLPDLASRTCPECRLQVPTAQQQCHGCGFKWRLRGPLSKTQPINLNTLSELGLDQDLNDLDRRAANRVDIEIPIIYHSDNLTFDARAQNLSRTGVFIASDLLDAQGTLCTLRVLPDGHPAVSIGGLVKHVVTSANAEKDQIPGMGIRFQRMSRGALSWIWSVLGDPLCD